MAKAEDFKTLPICFYWKVKTLAKLEVICEEIYAELFDNGGQE